MIHEHARIQDSNLRIEVNKNPDPIYGGKYMHQIHVYWKDEPISGAYVRTKRKTLDVYTWFEAKELIYEITSSYSISDRWEGYIKDLDKTLKANKKIKK